MAHGQVDDADARPRRETPRPPVLLVGVSGGRGSERALTAAADLSQRLGMAVVVAYVRTTSLGMTGLGVVGAVLPDDEEAELEIISLASRALDSRGVPWRFVVTSGEAARGLHHLAEVNDAALVVVGDPRPQGGPLGWLAAWLGGGVVRRLLRGECRPVLTVPAPTPVTR